MNVINVKGKQVKILKLDAIKYQDGHPNGIDIGYNKTAEALTDVEVGEVFRVDSFHTSTVTHIVNETTFKTRNSVYQIEVVNNPIAEEAEEFILEDCVGLENDLDNQPEKLHMPTVITMWDNKQSKSIVPPKSVSAFLFELGELYKKYNVSIAHEDGHGAFVIESDNQANRNWISDAQLAL